MWAVDENKHTASDWNLPAVLIFQNGTWLEVIHRCSPPAAASCSPSSHGKRCTEEKNYRWAGEKNYFRHELQWIWLKKSICSEVQELFFKKAKQFHPSSPSSSHSLHHVCTHNSTMRPVLDNSLVIDSNTNHLLSPPHPKKVSVPTISRHFLHFFIAQSPETFPKTLQWGFLLPFLVPMSRQVHCSSHGAFPELASTLAEENWGSRADPRQAVTHTPKQPVE